MTISRARNKRLSSQFSTETEQNVLFLEATGEIAHLNAVSNFIHNKTEGTWDQYVLAVSLRLR
jgi:hypothetical protein